VGLDQAILLVTVDKGEILADLGDVVVRGQLDERGLVGLGHGFLFLDELENDLKNYSNIIVFAIPRTESLVRQILPN
jgi:hypothetical protein